MNSNWSEKFIAAYIACALWASVDEDGNPIDDTQDAADLHPDTAAKMRADCLSFIARNFSLMEHWTPEQAGHDFWLTRNGHGTGFWDRQLPHKEELSDAARACGEVSIVVGDDGKLYQGPG